jgi:hypothetical protein
MCSDGVKNLIDAGIGLSSQNPHYPVRVLSIADGERRCVIFRRGDGGYGFREDAFYTNEAGAYWSALSPYSTICDSAVSAKREARSTISWLIGI